MNAYAPLAAPPADPPAGERRPRIVFVDDDEAILAGLAGLLRKERRRWDLSFACGAEAALAELARAPVDVVVSDMRMPGMDGAALLTRVQAEYPGTARIVLSGFAEREALVRAMTVAHQFLTKPCDGETLRSTLERACRVREILSAEPIRRLATGLGGLPPAPRIYAQLLAAVASPRASIESVARIVEQDPAIAAKVLSLSQSAFFARSQPVETVADAVVRLGLDLLKALVLSAGASAAFDRAGADRVDSLQWHGLLTTRIAQKIAPPEHAGAAATAAIVHDLGKLVIDARMPEAAARVRARMRSESASDDTIEREEIGATHGAVGAYVLAAWGVALPVVEAVAHHHEPMRGGEPSPVLVAVHVADALATEGLDPPEQGLAPELAETLAASLARWRTIARSEIERGADHGAP